MATCGKPPLEYFVTRSGNTSFEFGKIIPSFNEQCFKEKITMDKKDNLWQGEIPKQ